MTLAWLTSPLWLIINALVAFRLTRLWVADMLPPLPRVRNAIERWADARLAARINAARECDDSDPDHQAEVGRAGQRALQGGYNAARVVGPHEEAEHSRLRIYGGQLPVAYLVRCAWCSGYWISLAVFLAASLIPATAWAVLAVPLAISAVVGLLSTLSE